MIENRKSYRLPFRAKIIFGTPDRVHTGNTINISAGGLFAVTLNPINRDTVCRCVFVLNPKDTPIVIQAKVSRVVAPSENPDDNPGIGLNFINADSGDLIRIGEFMETSRKNFEMASAILAGGEPDLASLQPILTQMHLPPLSDLGELKFYVERILRSIEMIDRKNS